MGNVDCETTGLNVRSDGISIELVRIAGQRILASQRLEAAGAPRQGRICRRAFIHRLREQTAPGPALGRSDAHTAALYGQKPPAGRLFLVDVAMLNRAVRPLLAPVYHSHK